MADRRSAPWLAGLIALGVTCTAAAVAVELRSAALFNEVDEFSRSLTGAEPLSIEESEYVDSLWRWSGTLHQAVSPLAAGAVLAAIALFAVLALRWERRERRRA